MLYLPGQPFIDPCSTSFIPSSTLLAVTQAPRRALCIIQLLSGTGHAYCFAHSQSLVVASAICVCFHGSCRHRLPAAIQHAHSSKRRGWPEELPWNRATCPDSFHLSPRACNEGDHDCRYYHAPVPTHALTLGCRNLQSHCALPLHCGHCQQNLRTSCLWQIIYSSCLLRGAWNIIFSSLYFLSYSTPSPHMFQSKILVPSWGNAINYGEGTAISSRRNPAPPSFGHLPYPAHRYYQPLRDLNREDPVRELGRRAFSQCRNNVRKPVNNVKGSTKSMHNNPIHDNWAPRGESIEPASAFGPGHRASKGPCPTRCSAYLDRNLSTDNSEVDGAACLRTQQNMVLSPTITRWDLSPAMDKWSPLSDGPGSALHSADRLSQPDHYDAVETSVDKPYARLIHEALMQAPGHRMMLRDIYDWFIRHTTKPSESGTNGWQNSIRHNLSMNQVGIFVLACFDLSGKPFADKGSP